MTEIKFLLPPKKNEDKKYVLVASFWSHITTVFLRANLMIFYYRPKKMPTLSNACFSKQKQLSSG